MSSNGNRKCSAPLLGLNWTDQRSPVSFGAELGLQSGVSSLSNLGSKVHIHTFDWDCFPLQYNHHLLLSYNQPTTHTLIPIFFSYSTTLNFSIYFAECIWLLRLLCTLTLLHRCLLWFCAYTCLFSTFAWIHKYGINYSLLQQQQVQWEWKLSTVSTENSFNFLFQPSILCPARSLGLQSPTPPPAIKFVLSSHSLLQWVFFV